MFGLFRKKPPLTGSRRAEIELRLRRVIEALDATNLKQFGMVCSFDGFITEPIEDPDTLKEVVRKVAEHMKIDVTGVGLSVADLQKLEVASIFDTEKKVATFDQQALSKPETLIPAIAHRLAHSSLNDALMNVQWAPQFMACVRGFAVPVSNTLPRDPAAPGQDPGSWDANRLGLLTAADFGYVCALLARARSEEEPSWASLLRTDAMVTFRPAMKTFPAAGEMIFDAGRTPLNSSTTAEMREHLQSADPTFQYGAIMALLGQQQCAPELVQDICNCLKQRDELLVVRGLTLLAKIGADASDAAPYVEGLVSNPVDSIACKAAEALVALDPGELSFSIAGSVLEERWNISTELAAALGAYGHAASEVAPNVCRRMVVAAKKAMDSDVEAMAACLSEIHPSPQEAIESAIKNQETRDWLKGYLAELDEESDDEELPA